MFDAVEAGRNARSRQSSSSRLVRRLAWLSAALAILVIAAFAWRAAGGFGIPVTVTVDGYTEHVRTTQPDVRGLLLDLGLALRPEDRVDPAADVRLTAGASVHITRARPGVVSVDGTERRIYSHAATVEALLADAGVNLGTGDEVTLSGRPVTASSPLPSGAATRRSPRFALPRAWEAHEPVTVHLTVRRAVPVTVDDGNAPFTIYTTASTLGEALRREQITLYLGDRVQPSLGSRVHAGMRTIIRRSRALVVSADGRTVRTRTRGENVGDALTELGITVAGNDRVSPDLAEPVIDNISVRVTRVLHTVLVERESIPFDAVMVGDDELEIDLVEARQQGQEGEFRRRWQIVYEDGVENQRTLTDAWVAAQPVTDITAYGRKLVSRPVPGVEGKTYWRRIRMYATSYSKSTAGVSPTVSYYGITRMGLRMTKGIVAVDPSVVSLGTRVYVPGYGLGLAADTGGGIRSKMIDLGFDDENLESWHQWVWVYLLDPAPARSTIRWVLPKWPPE